MLKIDRQQQIMEHLHSHGSLRVSEAMKIFKASPATIRRDFDELCEEGRVQRGHGCITLEQNKIKGWMPPYQWRRTVQSAEKERIGERAATLVEQGDAVFIDGGSTTVHILLYDPPRILYRQRRSRSNTLVPQRLLPPFDLPVALRIIRRCPHMAHPVKLYRNSLFQIVYGRLEEWKIGKAT